MLNRTRAKTMVTPRQTRRVRCQTALPINSEYSDRKKRFASESTEQRMARSILWQYTINYYCRYNGRKTIRRYGYIYITYIICSPNDWRNAVNVFCRDPITWCVLHPYYSQLSDKTIEYLITATRAHNLIIILYAPWSHVCCVCMP